MITVVTWKWRNEAYRSKYEAKHVNALYHQFKLRLRMPHRFVCVTDDPAHVACETIPVWDGPLADKVHEKRPNCYRRLYAYSKEAEELFGERFVSVDLDVVVTGDLDPLFEPLADGDVDFQIWGAYTHPTTPYNGSMWGMRAGARSHVWEQFNPETTPGEARRRNFFGSDQAIMSMLLSSDEAVWTQEDGVYGYRNDLRRTPHALPDNARLVFFHGRLKPWMQEIRQRCPWIDKTGVTY